MIAHRLRSLLLAAACLAAAPAVRAAPDAQAPGTYRVGLAEQGVEPYSFKKSAARKGIYLDILEAVGKRTGDKFVPMHAPTSRIKALFEKNRIDIECGINPMWREDQVEISLYSRSFWRVVDVLLVRKGEKRPKPTKAAPSRIGAVRGYSYPKFEDRFKSGAYRREDTDNEVQMLGMLQKKRVDGLIIGREYAFWTMKSMAGASFTVAEEIDSVPVMFRIHVSRQELLSRFNRELAAVLKSGEVDRIVKSYQ